MQISGALSSFDQHVLLSMSKAIFVFRRIFDQLEINRFDYSGYYLVVLHESSSANQSGIIENILRDFWSIYIVNVNVLAAGDEGNEVKMYTYFPYTQTHCERATPIVINQYVNQTFLHSVEFPNKLSNMHGCRVIAAPFIFEPFVILATNKNGSSKWHGIEISVLSAIASKLNFTVVFELIPPQSEFSRMNIFRMVGVVRTVIPPSD